jgi:hypothetical protein
MKFESFVTVLYFMLAYAIIMLSLIVATFILAWGHHPIWATITGVPGFYMAYKALQAWGWN